MFAFFFLLDVYMSIGNKILVYIRSVGVFACYCFCCCCCCCCCGNIF